jgi:DNA-binding CsgD family transcriptional regulator
MTTNPDLHRLLLAKGLSNREAEVAATIAEGVSNQKAADLLFVTEKTIKFHLTSVYKKLRLKSRAELIVFCIRLAVELERAPDEAIAAPAVSGTRTNAASLPTGV